MGILDLEKQNNPTAVLHRALVDGLLAGTLVSELDGREYQIVRSFWQSAAASQALSCAVTKTRVAWAGLEVDRSGWVALDMRVAKRGLTCLLSVPKLNPPLDDPKSPEQRRARADILNSIQSKKFEEAMLRWSSTRMASAAPVPERGLPGRPSMAAWIAAEHERRCAAGIALPTTEAEAKAIADWLPAAHPGERNYPTPKTVKNQISARHRVYKATLVR